MEKKKLSDYITDEEELIEVTKIEVEKDQK